MSILGPDLNKTSNPGGVGLIDAHIDGWFQNDTDELYRGFPIAADDRVLDVGCGDGAITLYCAQRGAHIMVTDIEEESVKAVEHKILTRSPAASFLGVVCDSDPLLIESECASRIICREVLEHVEDPARVAAELARVGQPGALYLLTVPGETGEKVQQAFAPAQYFEPPNHRRIFSEHSFTKLVEQAGLEIISYSAHGFFSFFWMCIHWAVQARKYEGKEPPKGAVLDDVKPPFDDALYEWANLWQQLIGTPEGRIFKAELDKMIPKNQVIVARKPG